MKKKYQKYGKIFGIEVSGTRKELVLDKIDSSLKKSTAKSLFISSINPEILLESRKNKLLNNALKSSEISITDGTGVVLALKLRGLGAERIRGRQLVIDLFEIANEKELKLYLLGSTKEVNRLAIKKLKREYPNIIVRGNSGPVLDKDANTIDGVNEKANNLVVQDIKNFEPHILIVCFGAPKQEIWINKHKEDLPVRILFAAGGSLDYYSGKASVPPKFIANIGLEWLWRVVHEPKRIIRIFRALIIFPILVVFDR